MRGLPVLLLAGAPLLYGQGSAIDWPSYANDAQRTGWEKSDSRITKDNIGTFQLVMKMALDAKAKGEHAMSPPVVLGRLISYRGFKELAFLQSATDHLWAVDADMNRVFWEKAFSGYKTGDAACDARVVAMPALTPPAAFGARGRGGAAAGQPSQAKSLLGAGGFGAARPLFAVSNDGKLHLLNTSTGEDAMPAMDFLPKGAKASSLTALNGVIHTTTSGGCGGSQDGVWAIDLNGEEPKVTSFPARVSGLAIGTEGNVYVQTADAVVALSPELKQVAEYRDASGLSSAPPVIFTYHEKEMVVASAKDGRLVVLDAKSLGKLSETAAEGSVSGGVSSWQDANGGRWVVAPHGGPVVAYKLEDSDGSLVLKRQWVSAKMANPLKPVITSGFVFVLDAGGPAVLHAFDGLSGKEVYSSGDSVKAQADLTGITLANGRVFFTTTDGTLYGFGIFLER